MESLKEDVSVQKGKEFVLKVIRVFGMSEFRTACKYVHQIVWLVLFIGARINLS